VNCKRKSRRRFFLLMRSRTPPISTEFRLGGGLNPPNHPLATPLQKIILIAHKLTDGQTGHSTCLVSLFITLVHNCPLPLTTRVQLAVSVPNQVRRKQKGICKTTELVPILCTGELAQIDRNWLQQVSELVPIVCTGELAQIDRNWLQQILFWYRLYVPGNWHRLTGTDCSRYQSWYRFYVPGNWHRLTGTDCSRYCVDGEEWGW